LVVYDTVSVKGVDPVVQLGTLEDLLTGRRYDEIVDDPRNGHVVYSRDGGERLVCTLTDSLTTALAGASDVELQRITELDLRDRVQAVVVTRDAGLVAPGS
jgi:hypothetical protein